MATVSEVVVKYAARGAQEAQRADRNVRQSIKETAQTARRESGTIRQWMQQHKTALLAIGAATATAMAMIIRASPELSAQLATVRLAFSLLAMTIGSDLAPATRGIGETLLGLADSFNQLPPPIRKTISFLVAIVGIVGVVLPVIAALETLISGTVVASFLAWVGSLIPSISLMGVLSTVAGVVTSAVSALAAALGITVGAAAALVVAIVAIIAILVAYIFNIGGARDAINGFLADIGKFVQDSLAAYVKWRLGIEREVGRMVSNFISRLATLASKALTKAKAVADAIRGKIEELANDAYRWGTDLVDRFISGIRSKVSAARSAASAVSNAVRDFISFDNVRNDRMAQRWGSDMVEHFARGMEQKRSRIGNALPEQSPSGLGLSPATPRTAGAGGGTTIEITIEEGAIRMMGTGSGSVDTSRLAEEVSSEINTELGRR